MIDYNLLQTDFPATGDGCTMHFLTGDINIPNGPGMWAVSCSCGGGKTTNIVSIVAQRCNEGAVVVSPTIEESNSLQTLLIGKGVHESEILNLNSKDTKTMNTYKETPDVVLSYKVIIITHPRMWMEPLDLLIKGKKWFLIDELNLFLKPMTIVPKSLYTNFFWIDDTKGTDGIAFAVQPGKYVHFYDAPTSHMLFKMCVRGSKGAFHTRNDSLSQLKWRITYMAVRKYLTKMFNDTKVYPDHAMMDLPVYSSINSLTGHKVLLFDGTFDALKLRGNTLFTILETGLDKYSSPIYFERFKVEISRKEIMDAVGNAGFVKKIKPVISEMKRQIQSLQQGESILFFCWKDMELRLPEQKADGNDCYVMSEEKAHVKLCDALTRELIKAGIHEDRFSIHYRGSGKDKGTNQFKDFAAVSFIGDWNGGIQSPKLIEELYGGNCEYVDFKASLFIQAILRIRIRKHNGEKIKVFYSSDLDETPTGSLRPTSRRVMQKVFDYFCCHSPQGLVTGYDLKDRSMDKDVFRLKNAYPEILKAITKSEPLQIKIPLAELANALDKKEIRSRNFRNILNHMKDRFGIEIITGGDK